jgi:hypothetical protein
LFVREPTSNLDSCNAEIVAAIGALAGMREAFGVAADADATQAS